MDFFDNYENEQPDIKSLVEQYEEALANNLQPHVGQDEVEQIVDYYENTGHYDKALKAIEAALEQHPYSGLILLKKAQILFDLKITDEALECLDKAAIFEPSEMGIYLLRSEVLTFQSQHKEALEQLDIAMDLAEEDDTSDVWLHMADVYEDWEKYDEVYACLKACLKADMENEEALSRINYCMELTDQFEDAIILYKEIIEEHPYCFWAWYNLSYAYASLDLYEKAIDALQYVLAIDEDVTYAYRDLAQYYHEIGQFENALEAIETYSGKTKAESDIHLLAGKCHFELKSLKASRYCFRKAIRSNPSAHEAFYNLGMTYIAEEKWEQSIQHLKKAVELYPDNIEYLERLSETALHAEDYDEVKYSCSKAINLNAKYSRLYITLALSYLFNEEEEKALDTIEQGIRECLANIDLQYIKAAILLMLDKRKAALLDIEALLEEDFGAHLIIFKYFPSLQEDAELIDLINSCD